MDFKIKNNVLVEYRGNEKNVVIPFGITTIGEYAFVDSEIESVIIPNSVTNIEECAFLGCQSLKTVEVPESVSKLGESAFAYCKNLQKAKLPQRLVFSLYNENYNAFVGCFKLNLI